MAEAKTLSKEETKLAMRALDGLKASVLRAKTKEASDEVMVDIYEKRIREIDALKLKMSNGSLF